MSEIYLVVYPDCDNSWLEKELSEGSMNAAVNGECIVFRIRGTEVSQLGEDCFWGLLTCDSTSTDGEDADEVVSGEESSTPQDCNDILKLLESALWHDNTLTYSQLLDCRSIVQHQQNQIMELESRNSDFLRLFKRLKEFESKPETLRQRDFQEFVDQLPAEEDPGV